MPVRRLDELALDVDYVKIDVQGFELRVVRGLRETLARSRPLVMIETSLETDAIREELAPLGYSAWALRLRSRALSGQTTVNVLLLPAGRRARRLSSGGSITLRDTAFNRLRGRGR